MYNTFYLTCVLFLCCFVMPHNTGPLWTLAVKALIYVDLIETEMDKLTKNLELNSLISQCAEIQGVIAAGSLSRGCI